ncbi:MAG: phosphopentomutase [Verrucomicrobiales bacterium]|nr:phosphopentomutase [Verrucomicrobiales bacterium]
MAYGCLDEVSAGKDTTTGHWEIAGAPLTEPFSVFESFPADLVAELESVAGVTFLGNYAQSGTVILEELGAKHCETGSPILYTSADSVLQIAAHEGIIPLSDLYKICKKCRFIADRERIGRVIARPFIGDAESGFQRTANRKDFSLVPPETVLDALTGAGFPVIGVGKISDIFAGKGITGSHPTKSNADGMDAIGTLWDSIDEGLIFANLVDFDMLYGHRRDPEGYANCLAEFDAWWLEFFPRIGGADFAMITADHGNDPTWPGTDHTRERVPLLAKGPGLDGSLGNRDSFSDIAASLADFFGLDRWPCGKSVFVGND